MVYFRKSDHTIAELLKRNGGTNSVENATFSEDFTINSTSNIVDNQTISETINGGKYYNINVSDPSQRRE